MMTTPSPFNRYTREYRKIHFESKHNSPFKTTPQHHPISERLAFRPKKEASYSSINQFKSNSSIALNQPVVLKSYFPKSSSFETYGPHPNVTDFKVKKESTEEPSTDLYKTMYEEKRLDNRCLREELKDLLLCISSLQSKVDQFSPTETKDESFSDGYDGCILLEKRLAEQEAKLKKLIELNADNQRLRKENLSLTRVINRLTA